MGTLRSLGALARAVGPVVAASGKEASPPRLTTPLLASRPPHSIRPLPTVYWLAGAQACFTTCAGLFLLPILLLRKLGHPTVSPKTE